MAPVWEPVLTVTLVFASTTALAQPFYVPTGSMEPTIAIGDAIVATKFSYGFGRYAAPFGVSGFLAHRLLASEPRVGDIAVFRPVSDPGNNWVKRVIGLPGDHIQMKAGRLFINGRELPLRRAGMGMVESPEGNYREVPRFIETLPNGVEHVIFKWQWDGPLDNTALLVVPAGHVFMMGDDRDNSFDSRVSAADGGIGFVPLDNLVGRARFVLGSVDFLNASSFLGWPAQFRVSRVLKSL
jgi:signal peptidase I